ncbi:MAG: uracil-DNA glycosylase [Chlorobiaceae bacterium]|nr:uracil-DNA glycosylase [Chlorobiaceae bacterium]
MKQDEIRELLDNTKRYFLQQKDLFGNIIYTETDVKKKSNDAHEISMPTDEPWTETGNLVDLDKSINNCLKCGLGKTRTNFVFGVGNPNADVMFVGEAPGADEDAQGEPFVGRAGQLLNKILAAVELKREDVYICNILKCRPPNNRDPEPTEMELCTPYLYKQISLIQPKFIICLGRIAAQWLLQTNGTLGSMREKIHDYRGTKLIVTYHPAALLRNPNWKRPAWEDMKMFRDEYNKIIQR